MSGDGITVFRWELPDLETACSAIVFSPDIEVCIGAIGVRLWGLKNDNRDRSRNGYKTLADNGQFILDLFLQLVHAVEPRRRCRPRQIEMDSAPLTSAGVRQQSCAPDALRPSFGEIHLQGSARN